MNISCLLIHVDHIVPVRAQTLIYRTERWNTRHEWTKLSFDKKYSRETL